MNNKIKIIALFGESGSGKDTVLSTVSRLYPRLVHKIIGCTTRPKRDYEKDKKDYYFLTEEEFLNNKNIIGETIFNNWYYGIILDTLKKDKINIGVFSIAAIEKLLDNSNLEVYPFYIRTDDKIRLIRNLRRENNPNCIEICRRFLSDKNDFIFDEINFDYCSDWNNTKKDLRHLIKDLYKIIKDIS